MGNGEDALSHKTRRMIYNYIHTHPGVSAKKIRSIFDLNKSTMRYHLDYMERGGKIRSEPYGGKSKRYFCCERARVSLDPITGIDMDSLSLTQQRLISLIKNHPGITRKELLHKIDIDRKTLSSNLRKLEEHRIVWRVENNGAGVQGYEYITKARLKEMIYKRLLMKLLDDEIDEEQFLKVKRKLESLEYDSEMEF